MQENVRDNTDTMERTPTTSSAETPINGVELADSLYEQQLQHANTVGDVRSRIGTLMKEVGSEGEMGARLKEIQTAVDEATGKGAHDSVKLQDDLGGGVLGQNKVGTKESEMRVDQLSPEHVTANTRYTLDTVLHEDSEELGHAGQDPSAAATVEVIDAQGKHHDATTLFEGNVVENVSSKLGQRREGLPQETYLEGADLVQDIGRQKVDSYIRKGGANVGNHLQAEVWKTQPTLTLQQMMEQGQAVGMSSDQVLKAAQEQGRLPKGAELAMAA